MSSGTDAPNHAIDLFLACDEKYFEYARSMIGSFLMLHPERRVFLYGLNLSESQRRQILAVPNIELLHEQRTFASQRETAAWIANRRFVKIAAILEFDRSIECLFAVDADGVIRRRLDDLVSHLAAHDVGMIFRNTTNPQRQVFAGALALRRTPGAIGFMKQCAARLRQRPAQWYDDQVTLYRVFEESQCDGVSFARLPDLFLRRTRKRSAYMWSWTHRNREQPDAERLAVRERTGQYFDALCRDFGQPASWVDDPRSIRLSSDAVPLMLLQCPEFITAEVPRQAFSQRIVEDYDRLAPYLPKRATACLDIGCGVAGIDVMLSRHYDAEIDLHLLDRSVVSRPPRYGVADEFYGSLAAARRTLIANDVQPERIFLHEADESNDAGEGYFSEQSLDLVLSIKAWGFHLPLAGYYDKVVRALRPGGVLILDLRRGGDRYNTLKAAPEFRDFRVIGKGPRHHRCRVIRREPAG